MPKEEKGKGVLGGFGAKLGLGRPKRNKKDKKEDDEPKGTTPTGKAISPAKVPKQMKASDERGKRDKKGDQEKDDSPAPPTLEEVCGDALKPFAKAPGELRDLAGELASPRKRAEGLAQVGGDEPSLDTADIAELADKLGALHRRIVQALEHPDSLLPRNLGVGKLCVGCSQYQPQMVSNLSEFDSGLKKLVDTVKRLPGTLEVDFEEMLEQNQEHSKALCADLKKLADASKEAADAAARVHAARDDPLRPGGKGAAARALRDLPDALGGAARKARDAAKAAGGRSAGAEVASTARGLSDSIERAARDVSAFAGAAPKRVDEAFKPPSLAACFVKPGNAPEARVEIEGQLRGIAGSHSGAFDVARLGVKDVRAELDRLSAEDVGELAGAFAKKLAAAVERLEKSAATCSGLVDDALQGGDGDDVES